MPATERQQLTAASATKRKVLQEQKAGVVAGGGEENPPTWESQGKLFCSGSSAAEQALLGPPKCVALLSLTPGGSTFSAGLPTASSSSLELKGFPLPLSTHACLSPLSLQCQANLLLVRTP